MCIQLEGGERCNLSVISPPNNSPPFTIFARLMRGTGTHIDAPRRPTSAKKYVRIARDRSIQINDLHLVVSYLDAVNQLNLAVEREVNR